MPKPAVVLLITLLAFPACSKTPTITVSTAPAPPGSIIIKAPRPEDIPLSEIKKRAPAKEAEFPAKIAGTYTWNFTSSHTPADVHWPGSVTGSSWNWSAEVNKIYHTLNITFPGVPTQQLTIKDWTVARNASDITNLSFSLQPPLSSAAVKSLLAAMTLTNILDQMKAWPAPKDIPHTFVQTSIPFDFHQPLSDGSTLTASLFNIAKFTGTPDSWQLNLSVQW